VSFDIHYLRHGVELDLLLAPGSGAQAGGDRDLTQALDLDAVARRLGVCQIRLRQMVGSAAVHATA
jgi:hypothetical protein